MPGGREADHPSLGRILYSGSTENLKDPIKEKPAVETEIKNGEQVASRHGLFYNDIQ